MSCRKVGNGWGVALAMVVSCALSICAVVMPVRAEEPGKVAVIFIDPGLDGWKTYFNSPRMIWQTKLYRDAGYRVVARPGTADEVLHALLRPEVRALTYIGSDGSSETAAAKAVPTLAGFDAAEWRVRMSVERQLRYLAKGMPSGEAHDRAMREAAGFDLDSLANYTCGSLATTDLAEQFVRPGGSYYGVAPVKACPLNFSSILWTDVDQPWLEEYQVPQTPRPATTCDPAKPPANGDCRAWYEYGACLRRDGKADAMIIASLQWQADGRGLGHAFIAGWNGNPRLAHSCP